MKQYKQLPIPPDSAWDRTSFIKRHTPIWFRSILDGISNLWRWKKIIYQDRNWDDQFIFEILQHKLILQRKELVNANRHTSIPQVNRDITLCLNLIERIKEDYYGMEYMEYSKPEFKFSEPDKFGASSIDFTCELDDLDLYFNKYPLISKKIFLKDIKQDQHRLALFVAQENQKRCQTLLFKILNERINGWWD